ncbi:ABC transporter ATP-binding protein [Flexivirga meconopsidis]|uniref:ABC transporter ATP-binding protein n=1 Tax=Flexivirga meconopsidis TaxID=2977121 RepID=UPI00223E9101|nr:ATP-binding cassette domain-containing protein [Flexivirga meconopsidis]
MLRFENVGFTSADGERVLDGFGLALDQGQLAVVTGESGSGKTLLIQLAAGRVKPDTGRVVLDDEPVDSTTRGRETPVITQGFGLAASMTARENVIVPALAHGLSGGDAEAAATAQLEAVGLGDLTDHLIDELSGGQQQRVAIARALAVPGRLVLADEPTSALDKVNRTRMIDLLRARARGGDIVLMTSNDAELGEIADQHVDLSALADQRKAHSFGGVV